MFTGIVEELGSVEGLERQSDAVRLTVRATTVLGDAGLGDSISVNGCCLTVAERTDETWTADVMAETLDKTGLGALAPGDRVNLERAVTAGTRLGGHLVQGHVDAVGHVVRREPGDHWDVVTISFPPDLAPYLVDKGSITVDGVSLTVVEAGDASFSVSLIPETLRRTTLGFRAPGDPVNLEVDVIGKYVARQLDAQLDARLDARLPAPTLRRDPLVNFLQWLYDAHLTIAGHPITWREILGNGFGFASAIGGMRRRIWAWPVGIVGNVLLLTVFLAVTLQPGSHAPLFGQAGRQVFFIVVSIYGWWRWQQSKSRRVESAPAITPRWATTGERLAYVGVWAAGVVLCQWLFSVVGAGFPVERWYFWCDAWIFVGSIVATFAMARGWTDFWLAWIAVDLVGVPLLWHSQLYPTAILYVAYGALVVWGFVVWLRASRTENPARVELDRDRETAGGVA